MKNNTNPNYSDIDYLRRRAKKRIPDFAFDYLDGGCNSELNLRRNNAEIREVQLQPYYLRGLDKTSMQILNKDTGEDK
ncbi:MAG: alpha-hydroxy-acid oxidizing protein [Bacteroidota bacterium]